MKHIVSLADGTWLTPTLVAGGNIFSNIHRMNVYLKDQFATDKNPQIVFYSRGLGAVSGIRKYTAGGFASGIREEIEDIYINIASNYVDGDRIYLFGFSRGAVMARVVAGLIANVGLLKSGDLERFPDIWNIYKSGGLPEDASPPSYCQPKAKVEFLGVFDTVYGGNDNERKLERRLKFTGKRLSANVKHAIHILAIDEQRPFFRPLLWEESDDHPSMEQIWMPGVHGDVGGIYPANLLGRVSFMVMIETVASKTQLAFETKDLNQLKSSIQHDLTNNNVSVGLEWTVLWRVMCLGRKHYRVPSQKASKQFLHPIADELVGRYVNMRKEKTRPQYAFRKEFGHLNRR